MILSVLMDFLRQFWALTKMGRAGKDILMRGA
jgi:hypothetical protein